MGGRGEAWNGGREGDRGETSQRERERERVRYTSPTQMLKVSKYTYIHVQLHMYMCTCTHIYIYTHIYVYVCIYKYICACSCSWANSSTFGSVDLISGDYQRAVPYLHRERLATKERLQTHGYRSWAIKHGHQSPRLLLGLQKLLHRHQRFLDFSEDNSLVPPDWKPSCARARVQPSLSAGLLHPGVKH